MPATIQDAACCTVGWNSKLAGEHTYPDDYPKGAEITVTGIFDI